MPIYVKLIEYFIQLPLVSGLNERKLADKDVIGPSSKRKVINHGEPDRISKPQVGRPVDTESLETSQSYQQLSEKVGLLFFLCYFCEENIFTWVFI